MSKYSCIVTLDGNIGAGKSTILEYMRNSYDVDINVEPVDAWQPFLTDLYENKPSSCFNMQVRVWLDRCMLSDVIATKLMGGPLDATPDQTQTLIMERSPLFQRNVFIPANKKTTPGPNSITDIQYAMLQDMYDKTDALWSPDCYIYLRSDPRKCRERIGKRARQSEDAISLEYLQTLHDLHEATLTSATSEGKHIVCVDVEGKTVAEIGDEVWVGVIERAHMYKLD